MSAAILTTAGLSATPIAHRPLRTATGRLHRRALSMAEVVVSTAIVSVLLVAALQTLAAAGQNRMLMQQRLIGQQLAQGLMGEILVKPFADPEDGGTTIGTDSGESAASRADFDDIDDYDDWRNQSPQMPDGTALPGYSDWTTSVYVRYVHFSGGNLTETLVSDYKRIEVIVAHDGETVTTLSALRAARE
jgi:Tfp pilus assembly protein PilV